MLDWLLSNLGLVSVAYAASDAATGRVFGLDQQTFIQAGIQLLNAVILAVALGKILYNPVKEFLEDRTRRFEEEKAESLGRMAEADALIEEYEEKVKDIEKERLQVLENARLRAEEDAELILHEADEAARQIREKAQDSMDLEREQLRKDARYYIVEMASTMAKSVIGKELDSKDHQQVIEDSIQELEESKWLN